MNVKIVSNVSHSEMHCYSNVEYHKGNNGYEQDFVPRQGRDEAEKDEHDKPRYKALVKVIEIRTLRNSFLSYNEDHSRYEYSQHVRVKISLLFVLFIEVPE